MSTDEPPPGEQAILVDANLLVLLFVGGYDPLYIARFNRTSQYTIDDYNRLVTVLSRFQVIVTTPNVLTEASNLCNALSGWLREEVFNIMRGFIKDSVELTIPSRLIADTPNFSTFGLTDIGMLQVTWSQCSCPILTTDGRFASFARGLGVEVIEFSQL